jgi:SAM-dependent methyltransferase
MEPSRSGAAVQPGNRPHFYYDQPRPEVAALVPADCRRVLEVGCGGGQLGRLLKQRGHLVTGIELVPEVAEAAREHLDHVVTADVETDGFPFAPDSFDCLVFADVLEHLIDPWRVLRAAVEVLAPGGRVIASIPNVQNIDVIWRLLRGRWDYRERGITDIGHLRFFTLRTIHGLFEQANLEVVHVGYKYRRSLWRALTCWLTMGKAREFYTRQFLILGQRRRVGRHRGGENGE